VVEISDQFTAVGGRMLAELGADVIVVEPPTGSPQRRRPPFVDDIPDLDRSLRWWSGNAGKKSVTLDVEGDDDVHRVDTLIRSADIVIAGNDELGDGKITYRRAATENAALIWLAVTPFGLRSARAAQPVTDLTLLSGGGPVWNCGYDDHSLPPIRGGGDQASNIAGLYCAIGALIALAHRDDAGTGQLVDVNITAAANVTCEHVTYEWLVAHNVCRRQTGRHASPFETSPVQVRCADGLYANTGVLPRKPGDFAKLLVWLRDLDLIDQLPEAIFLQMAAERTEPVEVAMAGVDDEMTAMLAAARDAISLIASKLPAKEYFLSSQRRGFPAGAVLPPEDAFADEHVGARGFRVQVEHPELGATFEYPGTPYVFGASPSAVPTRPPLLGEHNHLLDELHADRRRGSA